MMTNFSLILQSISESILVLDTHGRITYSNSFATATTGFSSDEFLNQPLSFTAIDKDDTKSQYELSLVHKNGRASSEGWKAKKDGTKFWGEQILSLVRDEKNQFAGYTCMIHDISDRKQNESDLRKSEERFRLMVEGVKEYAIFLLDVNGYVVTWNDGAKIMKGYNAHEIIGKHYSVLYTASDIADKKPDTELILAVKNGKYEEEGWRVKKNGSVFWAGIGLTALYDERNVHFGFSKVTRDLSEAKEKEETLQQSEENYRLLVDQIVDYGIFMLDEKGRVASWNEGAKKIKGYSADEIIGKYFSIFYPEEDIINDKPNNELKIARKVGKYEEEGWRIRKDGTRFWANVIITAVYNTPGNLVGFSKVTRDLTERKLAEKTLIDSFDSFRLLAEELKITNGELSYANQELEQFTSIVSHDLQEPLRAIKSFLQVIDMKLDKTEFADLKGYIIKAVNSASRMKQLIENVLHYSQLSKSDMVKEHLNVNELIDEALQNLRTSVEESNAQITIENELRTVSGDRVQLVQLFQNLVGNAIKFTASGNPQVKIKCTREDEHEKFSVSDNGIGIAEGDLNKVFEIFKTLNPEKKFPGTGIGLAICKKIVARHQGKIWPESKLGTGTTFHFTLDEPQIINR